MPSLKDQRKGTGTTGTMRNENARTEFKTVLRIRPLLKKERDDYVVLEPIDAKTAALHPFIETVSTTVTNKGADLISPLSAVSQEEAVQTSQDVEYYFDRVFSNDANQEKIYFSTGQPMAMASMAALKKSHCRSKSQKTHLVISMGLAASGKTFTTTGNHHSLNKRKNDSDGLVPRILDSLFSQSKHNAINSSKKISFAVEMTILQVNQNKCNPAECHVHDLLQPAKKRSSSTASETLGSGLGTIASTILNSMDLSANSSSSSANAQKSYSELDDPVNVRQDPVSSECVLVNASSKTCRTSEAARDVLQNALSHGSKIANKKDQCHVWIELQPLLVSSRSGRTINEGERIVFLDMASCDTGSSKQRAARLRDTLPNRADAHTSVMHCLKAIQYNEDIASSPSIDHAKLNEGNDENEGLFSLDNDKTRLQRKRSFRKVPFLQHKVTMLLQPLFSAKHTNKTKVTLLLVASPSSRDHAAKKSLLNEVVALHRPSLNTSASTGIGASKLTSSLNKKEHKSMKNEQNKKDKWNSLDNNGRSKKEAKSGEKEQSATFPFKKSFDDEVHKASFKELSIERAPSMTYSDSTLEDEGILGTPPPPVAPDFKETPSSEDLHKPRQNFSPQASAPLEEPQEDVMTAPPPVVTADFPGVHMPPTSEKAAKTSSYMTTTPLSVKGCAEYDTLRPDADSNGDESPSESAPKFSYMKTINKVVHASKKKGRKVMEKMTVTTFNSGSSDHISLECTDKKLLQKLAEIEKKNCDLVAENGILREKNVQLQNRLDELIRGEQGSPAEDSTVCKSDVDLYDMDEEDGGDENASGKRNSAFWQGDDAPVQVIAAEKHNILSSNLYENNTNEKACSSEMTGYTKENKSHEQKNSSKQTYDDPFFQLMANMTNGTSSRWDSKLQSPDPCHDDETSCDPDDASLSRESPTIGKEEKGSPEESFDNELFQHMVMMNNLG